jgi:hypothetical protein
MIKKAKIEKKIPAGQKGEVGPCALLSFGPAHLITMSAVSHRTDCHISASSS